MVRIEEIESDDEFQENPLLAEDPAVSSPAPDEPEDSVTVPQYRPGICDPWSWSAIILAVFISIVVVKLASPSVMQPRLWSTQELAKYNDTGPLLLGILGSVFDVSQGRNHYGPKGGYHHFTGRDASRAFVSGNFSGDGLTDSLEGLSPLQVKSIKDWYNFFDKSKKYRYVGKLVGTFYDESGLPTKELVRANNLAARGELIVAKQKEDENRFPSCNSRWSPEKGGEVWCKSGFPRITDKISEGPYKGASETRCACFEGDQLDRKGLRLYEGCATSSQRCVSAPPQA